MLCFVLLIVLPKLSKGDDTGWLSPSTNPYNANVGQPQRVYTSNNSYATFNTTNDIADFGGFGISIPAGSVIEGIEIRIEGYNENNRQLEAVSLSWDGGTNYSTPIAITTFTNTEAYRTISSSLYGRAWQVSEFSNSNFRVRLDASFALGDLSIDHLQVKIYYSPPPTITSFTPNSACSGSGTSVVITGTDFTGATAVRFNGVPATSYTVNSAMQITATLPAGATTGSISVTNAGGTATSSSSFIVNSIPSAPVVGTFTQPTCVLATGSVVLNGLPSSGTWTLIRNDGVTTTGTGSSTTLNNILPGTYTFTVTNEDLNTSCPGSGTGLLASYFSFNSGSRNYFSGEPSLIRIDPTVNFNWGPGGPGGGIGNNYFAVRWEGKIQVCYSETYSFRTRSDDGIRLWVNGAQIINNWDDHAAEYDVGTISLNAGQKYDIVLEFYEYGGDAVAQLEWSCPSQPTYQAIPSSQLYSVATGCISASSASITINPQPTASTAPTAITGTSSICSGTTTSLTVSGGSLGTGASWKWYSGSCGETFVGTGSSITVNPTTTTTYFVRAEGTCNTTSCASGTITVNPLSTANISGDNGPLCAGDDAIFSLAGTTGATVTYKINLGTNQTLVLTGGTATINVSGATTDQTLTLVSVTNGICSQSLSETSTITVNPLPEIGSFN